MNFKTLIEITLLNDTMICYEYLGGTRIIAPRIDLITKVDDWLEPWEERGFIKVSENCFKRKY